MNPIARDTEPSRFSLRHTLSQLLFPRLHRSREARRGAEATLPSAAEIADDESVETQDAELIVAVFRTAILLIVIFAPRLLGLSHESHAREFWLAALAGIYNIGALVACLLPHRLGLRRPFIILMDVMLITTWIRLSGQWDLFPFYYIVVVVAAMWFRVVGGTLTAFACATLYILIWNRFAVPHDASAGEAPVMSMRVILEMALLMLVGCITGYIAKAQDGERKRRLANQLLLAQYQREIDISAQMQPLLFTPAWHDGQPSTPAAPFEFGAAMQPARPGYGGDYFDVLPLDDGRVALCIADVSGKSVRAQARLPLLKYALRALAPLYPQPDELVARLNETLLPDLQPDFYIALVYIILDSKHETLAWCNAGHMAPLLLSRDEVAPVARKTRREKSSSISPLAQPGPPLGVFEEAKYAVRTLSWHPGDQLLLYTDGLSDALADKDASDGEAEVRRLAVELTGGAAQSAQEIAQKLADRAASSASAASPARDDVTVVFVRFRNEKEAVPS